MVMDVAMATTKAATATVVKVVQASLTTAAITANVATMPSTISVVVDVNDSSAFSASALADCRAVLSLFNAMVFISSDVWRYRAIKNGCPYPVAKRQKIPPESNFYG